MKTINKTLKLSTLLLSLCCLCSCSSTSIDSRYFDINFNPTYTYITTTSCQWKWDNENSSSTNDITTINNPIQKTSVSAKNSNEGFFAKSTTTIDYKYEYVTTSTKFTNYKLNLSYDSFYVEVNYHDEEVTSISFPSDKVSVGYTSYSSTTTEKIAATEEITYKKEVDASTYKTALYDKTNVASLNIDYFCSNQDYLDFMSSKISKEQFENKIKPVYTVYYYKDGYSSSSIPKTTYTYQTKTTTNYYLLISAL